MVVVCEAVMSVVRGFSLLGFDWLLFWVALAGVGVGEFTSLAGLLVGMVGGLLRLGGRRGRHFNRTGIMLSSICGSENR